MKTTEYLYGIDLKTLPNPKNYFEAKIKAGQNLLVRLLNEPIEDRDIYRISEVQEAIEFNKKLLNQEI